MVVANAATAPPRATRPESLDISYIPDPRLRTKTAAKTAIRMAERLLAAYDLNPKPAGEHELFTAMHTCAYRAGRRGRRKPVPTEERVSWARRWKVIRDHVVERNLGLAFSMIGRFRAGHPDWEELRGEALHALVRAVEGFNPWRGFKFSTYACNAIYRALLQESRKASRRRLQFRIGTDERSEQPERVDTWSELYVDRLHQALDRNLGDLTTRESVILEGRFPMNGDKGLTLGEVGVKLGLSKERVRQIQNRALGKLRDVLDADPVLQ
jgi:RNA polymerase sigma factor (sigma-70 family)